MPDPADDVRRYEEQYRLSGDSIALARLAEAYRKAGDPQRALDLLAGAFPRHAGYSGTRAARARALADQRRREPAPDTRSAWEGVVAAERSRPAPCSEAAGGADDRPGADEEPRDQPVEDPHGEEDEEDLVTRTLAELYVRQGLLEEAAAIYVRLLGDHPDDVAARKGLERVRSRLGGEDADDGRRSGGPGALPRLAEVAPRPQVTEAGGLDKSSAQPADASAGPGPSGEASRSESSERAGSSAEASRPESSAGPASRPHAKRFQSIRDQLRALLQ